MPERFNLVPPGSSNPTGVEIKSESDTVPFHPYYTAKDGFGLGIFPLVMVMEELPEPRPAHGRRAGYSVRP